MVFPFAANKPRKGPEQCPSKTSGVARIGTGVGVTAFLTPVLLALVYSPMTRP